MSFFDGLFGVIGRDYDGKPLRVGDLVESVHSPYVLVPEARGILKVLGRHPDPVANIMVEVLNGDVRLAVPGELRKVDGPSGQSAIVGRIWSPKAPDSEYTVEA